MIVSEDQISCILQEPGFIPGEENSRPSQAELLAVQCLWQNHSKSYDSDSVDSSGNGAAIGTIGSVHSLLLLLLQPGRNEGGGAASAQKSLKS